MPETDELIPTRASLILRLKNWDDQKSWQEFFDTYSKLIFDIATKGGLTKTEAQDVLQEIMLGVAKNITEFNYDPNKGSFKGWLLKLTRWRMVDQIRKRKKMFEHEALPNDATDTHPLNNLVDPASDQLEVIWNAEWEKKVLAAALAKVKRKLDPVKYQIFDFYVNKNWEPEKVAEAFQVSIEQVYQAKFLVTQMLKDAVRRIESGLR